MTRKHKITDFLFLPQARKVNIFLSLAITLALIAAFGLIDKVIGWEYSFSIFYFIPITVAVFLRGKRMGLAASLVCALVWIFADIEGGLDYSSLSAPIWNTLIRLGYFTLHTLLISKLLETIREVKGLSLHDSLTGAANWRYFEEFASSAIKLAAREGKPVTLVFFDVDNFKELNDELGHGTGDEVLQLVAATFMKGIRPKDLFARLGGDEFALLLASTDRDRAREVLMRIREALHGEFSRKSWKVTLSIGSVTFREARGDVGSMLKLADHLMYEVKKSGKNDIRMVEAAD